MYGMAIELNSTSIVADVAQLNCAAAGLLRVKLTVARKPAQKLPEWEEVDSTQAGGVRRRTPEALSTGGGSAFDRHIDKPVVVGTISVPTIYASSKNLAFNAPELELRGQELPDTHTCEAVMSGKTAVWNLAHALELESPQPDSVLLPNIACDIRTRFDGSDLCGWEQLTSPQDNFDWMIKKGRSSPVKSDTFDLEHNRRVRRT